MNVPVEIFSYICDIIPTKDLCSTMLVSRLCCDVAERLLYSSIHLDFFDTRQRPRSTMCLQTLSTSASAAAAVRHLEIRGLGLLDAPAHTTFIAAMMLATNVSSLDIMLIIPSQSPVFPASLVTSSSFLPHLVALNVDDSKIIPQLVPGRPCASVRIQDTIPEDCLNDVVDALARAAVPIEHLQLKLAIPGEHAILPSFIPIAHSFRSLISLGIQFVLPSPSLTWESLEGFLRTMAALLSPIMSLRVVSLVTIPDPGMPLSDIPALTRNVAEMIVAECLPQLHRIEVRWNGWLTQTVGDDWVPIHQSKLLRRAWHYRDLFQV